MPDCSWSSIRRGAALWSSALLLVLVGGQAARGAPIWPALPEQNAAVEIPAQEWPLKPGPRTFRAVIHYPGGKIANVTPQTGLMLTLHNWGGTDCVGTANPDALANRLNVVAICVNYLQSGKRDSIDAPEPYDHGHLQALDALRALWFVFHGLQQRETPFDGGRIFATGGSGGGNVSLMCNKLAPRTFTGLVDMCGMKRLSDDVAFNLPGGTPLNARWSRDPASPYYLSVDEQELRFVGHPEHLQTMKALGTGCRIVIVHGVEDASCPFADAEALFANLQATPLDAVSHFIRPEDLDGTVFTSAGHALGNRTEIVFRVAGAWLDPDGPETFRRAGPTDFERKDEAVRYATTNGAFVVSYAQGYPVSRFEPVPPGRR